MKTIPAEYYQQYNTIVDHTLMIDGDPYPIMRLGDLATQIRNNSAGAVSSVSVEVDDIDGVLLAKIRDGTLYQLPATIDPIFSGYVVEATYAEGKVSLQLDDIRLSTVPAGIAPRCFGKVLRVPAVPSYKVERARFKHLVNPSSTTIRLDSSELPQGEPIRIVTQYGIHMLGTLLGEVFTVSDINAFLPYTVTLLDKPPLGYDQSWIKVSSSHNLTGLFIWVTRNGQNYVNRIAEHRADGMCRCYKAWRAHGTNILRNLDSTFTVQGVVGYPRTDWPGYEEDLYKFPKGGYLSVWWAGIASPRDWLMPAGTWCSLYTTEAKRYYVNEYACTRIVKVEVESNGELVDVPSSWYTKVLTAPAHLAVDTWIGDLIARAEGTDWPDKDVTVYVSLESEVAGNPIAAVKKLVDGIYTIDAIDETEAAKYPSNFALLERKPLLDEIADIAWQGRYGLQVHNGHVNMRYLCDPTTDGSILADDIVYRSQSTKTDYDRPTGIKGEWRADYASSTYTYGEGDETATMSIYQQFECMKRSVDFWSYRLSKRWQRYEAKTVLPTYQYDVFDTVVFDDRLGSIVSMQLSGYEVAITVETAFENDVLDEGYWTHGILPYPTITDPLDGLAESDKHWPRAADKPSSDTSKTQFHTVPSLITRGTAFDLVVDNATVKGSQAVALKFVSGDTADTISSTTLTFVNGRAIASLTITGGTKSTTGYFVVLGKNSTPVPVRSSGAAGIWPEIWPTIVTAGQEFTVRIIGPASTTVFMAGHPTLTEITFNAFGAYDATDWVLNEGPGAITIDGILMPIIEVLPAPFEISGTPFNRDIIEYYNDEWRATDTLGVAVWDAAAPMIKGAGWIVMSFPGTGAVTQLPITVPTIRATAPTNALRLDAAVQLNSATYMYVTNPLNMDLNVYSIAHISAYITTINQPVTNLREGQTYQILYSGGGSNVKLGSMYTQPLRPDNGLPYSYDCTNGYLLISVLYLTSRHFASIIPLGGAKVNT